MINDFYSQSIRKSGLDDRSLCTMRRTQRMLDAFRNLRKKQLQTCTCSESPELLYIDKTIKGFEKDLQTLQVTGTLK